MLTSRRTTPHAVPSFGRRAQAFVLGETADAANQRTADARLFALTFVGGFLFMSVFLA